MPSGAGTRGRSVGGDISDEPARRLIAIGISTAALASREPRRCRVCAGAKCSGLAHSVGVREVSRLVSRLRHRQFGVLVTTSYVHDQAYREIREDGHPVVIIAGRDLVDLLKGRDFDTVTAHLRSSYPMASA